MKEGIAVGCGVLVGFNVGEANGWPVAVGFNVGVAAGCCLLILKLVVADFSIGDAVGGSPSRSFLVLDVPSCEKENFPKFVRNNSPRVENFANGHESTKTNKRVATITKTKREPIIDRRDAV